MGLLVKRDALLAQTGASPGELTAGEVCRTEVALHPEVSIEEASRMLDAQQVGRLPVVVDDALVGTVSRSDIAAYHELVLELGPNSGDIVDTISSGDEMFNGSRAAYFRSGLSGLRCIKRALEAAGASPPTSILDFACGHGRVLRMLKAAFPTAACTASDLDRGAVEFCRTTFGARGIVSREDPGSIEFGAEFDLIWCGSLFTHLDAPRWEPFLSLLASHLAPSGALVFTIHGEHAAEEIRRSEGANEQLFEPYDRTGFGYVDYPGTTGYGTSLSTLEWACATVDRNEDLQVVTRFARGWNDHQDVIACVRKGSGR
jgi:SAM-dependent methyltransferase